MLRIKVLRVLVFSTKFEIKYIPSLDIPLSNVNWNRIILERSKFVKLVFKRRDLEREAISASLNGIFSSDKVFNTGFAVRLFDNGNKISGYSRSTIRF
jgi:hypothetical protein